MSLFQKIAWLSVAGACGTLARYFLGRACQTGLLIGFPSGTLVVNVLGSFLFGLLWTLPQQRLLVSAELRSLLMSGFLGAFTTFSTFAFETCELWITGRHALAVGNWMLQNGIGLSAMVAGMLLGARC